MFTNLTHSLRHDIPTLTTTTHHLLKRTSLLATSSSSSSSSSFQNRNILQRTILFSTCPASSSSSSSSSASDASSASADEFCEDNQSQSVLTHSERRLILGYSPSDIYDVVIDVDAYKEFLPWCDSSEITSKDGDNRMLGKLVIGFPPFTEQYSSVITVEPKTKIHVEVQEGALLEFLKTDWEFEQGPRDNSCWLKFNIQFSFASELHATVASMFFREVALKMRSAFESRCKDIYGRRR